MEIQQTPPYARYIRSLGWEILSVETNNIFIKKLPLIGTYAKIQRPTKLPYLPHLIPLLRKYGVTTLAVEPSENCTQSDFSFWTRSVSKFFRIPKSPFLPTKTIRVGLSGTEQHLFRSLSEAKRRAVRKAWKNNIYVTVSSDIDALIAVKNKSAGFLGSITTVGIPTLFSLFSPKNAAVLLAYQKRSDKPPLQGPPLGAILLLWWDSLAYYWIAGSLQRGKTLAVPTLLVWEALRYAKKIGCTQFDFLGVWDERLPEENTSWKGFTRFKEGFGGQHLYYPITTL